MKKKYSFIVAIVFLATFYTTIFTVLSSPKDQSVKYKIALGRYLFYDTRLSYNQTKSCSSCHDPKFAFTDGYRQSAGSDGYTVRRNAPTLLNVKYQTYFTWGDSSIKKLSQQLLFPMFNQHPNELGWTNNEVEIITRFENLSNYRTLFSKAFPADSKPFVINNFIIAISNFEEQLVSFNSTFDLYLKGNKKILNEQAIKGMKLFNSAQLGCSNCHQLQESIKKETYFNTGLYNVDDEGAYPLKDQGLFELTKNPNDKGKFRVPSLRNILLTAPYTHDGSVETIEQMISIYQRGGRLINYGKNKGDGKLNINKSNLIKGFTLTSKEKENLLFFLSTLTDTSYLRNYNLLNPFNEN